MRTFNSHEALAILKEYNITHSIQMVTQWLREGKIKAERTLNRKDGYLICEEDLYEFIEEKRPGWTSVLSIYHDYVDGLDPLHNRNNSPGDKAAAEPDLKRLKSENDQLKKDYQFLMEFCDLQLEELKDIKINYADLQDHYQRLETMLRELIKVSAQPSETVKETNKSPKKVNQESVSIDYTYFVEVFDDVFKKKKRELSIDELNQDEKHDVYLMLCEDNGDVKEDLIVEGGSIKSPTSDKSYKQNKRLIKAIAIEFLEKYKKSPQPVAEVIEESDPEE